MMCNVAAAAKDAKAARTCCSAWGSSIAKGGSSDRLSHG